METNKNLTHPKYRSDIDGLRAIAVLSVVIYHAFPNFLKGGFIGVDIFFVISGFLISTIIFENLNNSSFSFATFYSRRIRRIFPALITVLITAVIFGYYVLFSDEFKQLGRHIIGGATFSSNFTLLKESGYFDTASEFKPLLHLWSLGIEEQFYIIFPLVCYFLYKYNVRLLLFIIPLTIISYYLNIKGIKTDITKTFYYPHTRFWELLFGSLLAYFTINKCQFINSIGNFLDTIIFNNKENSNSNNNNSKHRLLNLLSILGFLLLVYGLIRINSALKFPGKWALVPVIGSVLIILSGKESIINKFILGNKILVWFGKISFPLYLWHWVLLAYARIIYGEIPPQSWRISLVIAAIILSYLTYKFIESPLRFGGNNKKKVIFLCLMMIIIGGFGWSVKKQKIASINHQKNIIAERIVPGFSKQCDSKWWEGNYCNFGNLKSNNNILIFGDSHAHHITEQLDILLGNKYSITTFTAPSCYVDKLVEYPPQKHCILLNEKFNKFIVTKPNPDIVIIGQRWFGTDYNHELNYHQLVLDKIDFIHKNFSPKHIFILGSTPKVNFECEKQKIRKIPFSFIVKKNQNCFDEISINEQLKFMEQTQSMQSKNIHFIYPYNFICDAQKKCSIIDDKTGNFIYADYDHFSLFGSKFVVDEIKKIIESN